MTYIGAPIVTGNTRRGGGSIMPPAEMWLRADRGLVTDGAVDFVAADRSCLIAPNSYVFRNSNNGTNWVCFWFKKKNNQNLQRLVHFTQPGWHLEGINFHTTGGANSELNIGIHGVIKGSFPVSVNQWYMAFGFFDNGGFHCSIDNSEFIVTAGNTLAVDRARDMSVGGRISYSGSTIVGSVQWADAYIDSLTIGKSCLLTPREVRDYLYSNGRGRIDLDLTPEFVLTAGVANSLDLNEESGTRKDRRGNADLVELCSPIVSPDGLTYGPNLMPNSTFEVGVSNTVITDAGGSIGILSHETEDPIAGAGSLRLRNEIVGTNGQHPRVRQTATQPIKPATRYRMRLKTKLVSGTAVQGGLLSIGGHPVSAPPLVDGELTTEIQSWDKSFLTRVELANNDIFMPWRGIETFDLLMDDWYVEQEIAGVRNSGFEQIGEGSQTFADWSLVNHVVEAQEVTRDLTEKKSGDASCKISNKTVKLQHAGVSLSGFTIGKTYRVEGYSKSTKVNARVVVRASGSSGAVFAASGSEWTYFSVEYKSSTGQIQITNDAINAAEEAFDLWIDDVTITPAELASAPGIAAGQPQNGDQITSITDEITGSQLTLTQTAVANRATFRDNQVDGKPALEFDGAGDFLQTTGFEIAGYRAIYAIVKLLETGGASEFIGGAVAVWDHSVQRWVGSATPGNGGSIRTCVERGVPPYAVIASPDITVNDYGQFVFMKSWIKPGVQNNARIGFRWKNIIRESTGQNVSTSLRGLRIGRGSQRFLLAELIVHSKETTFEQEQNLLGYFKDRYPSLEIE